jgi:hypothetical protein
VPILRMPGVRQSDCKPGCWKRFGIRITPKSAPAPAHIPNCLNRQRKVMRLQSSYRSSYNKRRGFASMPLDLWRPSRTCPDKLWISDRLTPFDPGPSVRTMCVHKCWPPQ